MEQSTVLLDELDKHQLKIPEQYQNEDGNLDREQLMDDLDIHSDFENDIYMLQAMLNELEARVIHEEEK